MKAESIFEIVRRAESNYLAGNVKLGKYVNFSMHETIETIDAYLNSKHTSGLFDSLNREKPFFNIVVAAANIWFRATDIDRKDVRFVPQSSGSVVLAFVADVLLQHWMDQNNFGKFLNDWGRTLSRYGSAVSKFVEKDGELVASVVPWNRYIADPVSFDALPRIEKFYKTPAQLRQMKGYDQKVVDSLITAVSGRKTLDGEQKDKMSDFIELYEVHGMLDSRLLEDDPQDVETKDIVYRQQMHVVSYVATDKADEYTDYCLYKGRESKDPYVITHLIEEDGRTLSIGAVEYLFDAQWMANHSVKNMKDTLDLASKLIFDTTDKNYAGQNVFSAIETGDIFYHKEGSSFGRIANDSPSITALQNFGVMWQNLARELTSTPDAMRGNTMPSGTPMGLGTYLGEQASNLFGIMTENKGISLEEMIRAYIISHLKKHLKNKDEVVAILDDAGIKQIDSLYIPTEAVRRFNKSAKATIIAGGGNDIVGTPSPYQADIAQEAVKQELASLGNKRFFKPDELDEQTWADILSDFAWDNLKVEITDENNDKQAVLATLVSMLKTAVNNPELYKLITSKIMQVTGVISPLEVIASTPAPTPTPTAPSPTAGP